MKSFTKNIPLYADNPKASNVSIAGGAVKLLSVLLLIGAVPATAVTALAAVRLSSWVPSVWFVLEELEDGLGAVLILWAAFVFCRYAAEMMARKARLMAGQDQEAHPPQAWQP